MIYWIIGVSLFVLLVGAILYYDRYLQKKIDEWEKNQKD
jgi:hypothetical protein